MTMNRAASFSSENPKRIAKERRSIVKLRGYQDLCVSCRRSCKVWGAPNSTFECFMREPE